MTRYALLTEFAPPDVGGIQASVGPLIETLGDEVTVMAPKLQPHKRRMARSLFSGRGRPRWWWLVRWLRQSQRGGLKTVIFGHFSAAVMAGYIARRRFGLPYVVLIHGNDLLSEQRRWPTKMFVGTILRQAKFVGVNSGFVESLVSSYGVKKANVVRTHPYVLAKDIPSVSNRVPGKRIVTVARLVPRKNIDGILRALVDIRKTFPDVQLDIVGDGSERQRLEELTKTLELNQCVTFHGAVDEATKWKVLQQADIFVMAPIVRARGVDVEGLGLVYLEAAACGLPIVASNTGGVRDAVVNQQTGLLIDPTQPTAIAEAVIKLLQQPDVARKFGQAGRDLVINEFTDNVRIPRFLQMLRSVPETEQPLVSIIIPAFNATRTIGATLASVKQQTWKKVEIIVVDDGSVDDIRSAIKPFMYDVKILQQKNSGAPTARNVGFEHSAGEFVLFLDADIVLQPQAIEKMVVAIQTHPTAAFTYSDFTFGWKKFHLFEYSSTKLRQQNYIHTSSLMRRAAFTRFDQTLKKFQDWDLWLTMDKAGQRGLWIPAMLFRVTQGARGTAMSTWLPSFMYKLPWLGQGKGNVVIAKYREAERVIREKHHLSD